MFNIFNHNSRLQPSTASNEKGESLNQSLTDIAVQLINGQGGPEWRGYFLDLFLQEPRFLKDVSPEHREALITLLNQHKKGSI